MNAVDVQGPLHEAKEILRQCGALPQGDYEKVEGVLGAYLLREPDNREARFLRGIALGKLGRFSEGEEIFNALLKEGPPDPVILNGLGVIWLMAGKLHDALGAFLDAIEEAPARAEFQYNLGETYKRLEKLNAASMAFARAAELDPDFGAAYNNLGLTLFKLGKPQKALVFLSQFLERDPSNARVQKNRDAVQQAQDEGKTKASLEEDTDLFFVFFDDPPEDRQAPEVTEATEATELPQAPGKPGDTKDAGGSDRTSVLELLRFLRLLTGALPPKALELYSNSDARLAMEYIIGALEGHTGLFRELQGKGLVPSSPDGPAEPDSAHPDAADTNLADTLEYIRSLAASLADRDLPAVLNRKIEGIISEIQRIHD
jgi:tetratricopeptide (TPR) repeat protein